MAPKRNPLKLNTLQLKTLTILQALCDDDVQEDARNYGKAIPLLPSPHGNHFHVGPYIVMVKDATGLNNVSVWAALTRKGLVDGVPPAHARLTSLGVDYQTGFSDKILRGHDH
mgnify:CR=1 FL=1